MKYVCGGGVQYLYVYVICFTKVNNEIAFKNLYVDIYITILLKEQWD